MSVKILCLGKTSEKYILDGMAIYQKRLSKYGGMQWIELPDNKKKNLNPTKLKEAEAKIFLKEIKPSDYVIGLDENGRHYSSRDFAAKWSQVTSNNSDVVILIGGAFGYGDAVYQRMNSMISLSEMTFSHQLVRLLFLEQLYRAYTILHGEPYHND